MQRTNDSTSSKPTRPQGQKPKAKATGTKLATKTSSPKAVTQTDPDLPLLGQRRVIIEGVQPEIDAGSFPIKRVPGELVLVDADIFADGHDVLCAVLKHRLPGSNTWEETPMTLVTNDRWRGSFTVQELGAHAYTVEAWVDHFHTWRHDLEKKTKANMDVSVEILAGAKWTADAAERAKGEDAQQLRTWAEDMGRKDPATLAARVALGLDHRLSDLIALYPDRSLASVYERELGVVVDPLIARFGAWYEMFPRSCATEPGRHGTFKDCEAHLPRLAAMGFDVLYLPPIHPIGHTFRKGKNNNPKAEPGEPGSPWGIGSQDGGHKAVHKELGTLEDFKRLVVKARKSRIEIALDIAFQCAPDHPYVRDHPEWFRKRPDGSIQYAENPPKKYQDIYPIDFESRDWQGLWRELKSIFEYWVEQGVTIFRVDNPHTKSFPFWEWAIGELKRDHPELVFLSEAFTRPKVMYRLAKLGFTQSYNYFPWRNTAEELTEYMTEVTRTEVREYFRPNLWPNTPDILTQHLQYGGRPAFMSRLILAATLGASYGIYGPAYELSVNRPKDIGKEEYLDSEKYEIKHWKLDTHGSLGELMAKINRIRRENPAFHTNDRLEFHPVDNPEILAYTKTTESLDNLILVVVNLDPHHVQAGWVTLDLTKLGILPDATYQVHDLLTGSRFLWHGARNYIDLSPTKIPAHIFRVRRSITTEQDFDYYM